MDENEAYTDCRPKRRLKMMKQSREMEVAAAVAESCKMLVEVVVDAEWTDDGWTTKMNAIQEKEVRVD